MKNSTVTLLRTVEVEASLPLNSGVWFVTDSSYVSVTCQAFPSVPCPVRKYFVKTLDSLDLELILNFKFVDQNPNV